jgi:hypothetical protein
MATYRCPTHDVIFESHTDSRPPGSRGNKNIPDQPDNCHPDCPMKDVNTKGTNTGVSAVAVPARKRVIS